MSSAFPKDLLVIDLWEDGSAWFDRSFSIESANEYSQTADTE